VLGLNEFDNDYLFVLECLLKNLSAEETRDAAAREYPPDSVPDLEKRFAAICTTLRNSIPFKAMFADAHVLGWCSGSG